MDTNSIDIIGERNDGGIDLFIIIEDSIEKSEELQTQLLDKIENYLIYINSSNFKDDFPSILIDDVCIMLKFAIKPSDRLQKWLYEIKLWVNTNGVNFSFITN